LKLQSFALILFFALLNGWGYWHAQQIPIPDQKLNVTMIQANIGNHEKLVAEKGYQNYQDFILNKHIQLSTEALKKHPQTQLLIWPESAIPAKLDPEFYNQYIPGKLLNFTNQLSIPILTGGLSRHTPLKSPRSYLYNALFVFQKNSEASVYRKSILLAFGEYLPFGEAYPWLYKLLPFVSDFGKGKGPETLALKVENSPLKIGPQICYEGLFSSFSNKLSEQGAQILVNLTNDSWFTPPLQKKLQFESLQHLYMTSARSIETRLPLLRATNTGISTGVDQMGNLYNPSTTLTESIVHFTIPFSSSPTKTFFVQWGHWDWLFWLILFFIILGAQLPLKKEDTNEKR